MREKELGEVRQHVAGSSSGTWAQPAENLLGALSPHCGTGVFAPLFPFLSNVCGYLTCTLASMYMQHPRQPEEGTRSPETGDIDRC